MERQSDHQAHIISFLFPAQGHINPNLQFCKRLVAKGLKVTLITTISIRNTIYPSKSQMPDESDLSGINIEFISDGFNDAKKVAAQIAEDIDAYLELFKVAVMQSLIKFLQTTGEWDCQPKVIVYDSNMPWIQDVADQFGLYGAAFFTASCAVANIFHLANEGVVKLPVEGQVSVPGMPLLESKDVPSSLHEVTCYSIILKLLLSQFDNLSRAKWVLFSSFDQLEGEVLKTLPSQWAIKTIGPTIPSMYLDKRLNTDRDYGLYLLKPDEGTTKAWLNAKKEGSVLYISFGSLANLSEEQAQEVAYALKTIKHSFIWVVREPERKKLPTDFIENLPDNGLILSWCSQLEVLNHSAIGCFLTHCGWNSVLEALSAGVPMVAMPQWMDQPTNAKYVEDVWKVGIRVKTNQSGKVIPRDEINHCISQVMDEGTTKRDIEHSCHG
uniref:Glycosyltransferase n=1 Tax=Rhodiola rosea TaxID=203015 RepID=A0A2I6B3Q7_RHORB|nr:uridine 5'-diphospho-glucosyltransferase 23 [Rhodiola rosea]